MKKSKWMKSKTKKHSSVIFAASKVGGMERAFTTQTRLMHKCCVGIVPCRIARTGLTTAWSILRCCTDNET